MVVGSRLGTDICGSLKLSKSTAAASLTADAHNIAIYECSSAEVDETDLVTQINGDVESIENASKKRCPKCGEIRDLQDFWDSKLKSGNGGYGRNCMTCKATPAVKLKTARSSKLQSRYGRHW